MRARALHGRGRVGAAALLLLVATAGMACSSDDDEGAEPDATTTTAEGQGGDAATVEVGLVDYGFEDLPDEIDAGTKLTVVNRSEVEMHELVALRLPDDEERSVEDLLALPEEEQGALFGDAPPDAVLLAEPSGAPMIAAVGDGTLSEPGRYLIACFIPTGADPAEFMAAAAESEGPPQVDGGPPHFVNGMFAELRVV